jgi:ATP-dependent DNA ligase
MDLPVAPPLKPMLAKRVVSVPRGPGWIYEPKWDGFRAIAFRDRDRLVLQSRDERPLERYFPELGGPLLEGLPERSVVDGEIVIAGTGGLDFEALLQRIHPAESRIARLAEETPAALVVWDLLCLGDRDLRGEPFADRRRLLEEALAGARAPLHVTPVTSEAAVAEDWFHRFEGAGLDGVIAKRADGVYEPGKRAMLKIKHQRTADCVVAGFRWHKGGEGERVGSLLLGLYDEAGTLHHVGVAASFSAKRRVELLDELSPLREGAAEAHPWRDWTEQPTSSQRVPGAQSRWNRGKTLAWEPLRPELTVEVSYDHMQGTRFRHTAHFVRWRPDKPPAACTYDQLDETPPLELREIFGAGTRADRGS